MRTKLILAVKLLLAAAIFAWLIVSGKLDWRTLADTQFGAALAAYIGCRVAVGFCQAWRWKILLEGQDLSIPFYECFRIEMIGKFFGLVAPTSLAADGARAYYSAQRHAGRSAEVATAVVADRFVGALTIALLALAAAVFTLPAINEPIRNLLLIAAAGILAAVAAAWVLGRSTRSPWAMHPFVGRIREAIGRYQSKSGILLACALFSLISHAATIAGVYFVFRAVGQQVPLTQVFAIQPLLALAAMIPLTPMGLGVVDATADELYALINVPAGAEMVLLTRVVGVAVALVGGALFVLPHDRPGPAEADLLMGTKIE